MYHGFHFPRGFVSILHMLDIKFIRDNAEIVREAIRKKKIDLDLDDLLRVDAQRLQILGEVESMRAKQNSVSKEVVETKDAFRDALILEMRTLKDSLQKKEEELRETMKKWQQAMVRVPNVPDISVPEGTSDADNQELRTWGEKPVFSFQPKNHSELMVGLGMADFERGAKSAGFRGYFLKNDGAALSFAVWQFALDHMRAKGFEFLLAPSLVRKEAFMGTGYLPQGEEDLYKTQDDAYLAGTAEVGTMAFHMDEVLTPEDLPKKYVAFSPCFRREAGSHGKDTKGLIRVHEFYKLEQVVLCEPSHAVSVAHHEELTQNAEEMLQALGLPYRVVVNCGGDLGLGQVKKYDIEAWVPSENAYRETHSSSYFHDFQTRRLNIRYRDAEGKLRFVHSLNNTAIATPRILVSIVENYQNEDGTIRVPEALKKYLGKDLIAGPSA